MATLYGVTPTGFVRKPLSQIIADLTAQKQGIYGQNIDLDPAGPYYQDIAATAAEIDEVWQLAEAVYDSMDPDDAEGPRLVSLCAITGTKPKDQSPSTVTATAIGTNGSAVAAGTRFQVVSQGPLFLTMSAATIATLTAWATSVVQAIDGLVQNASGVYRVIAITGDATTASSGSGPVGTTFGLPIVDHNVTWLYMGPGTAAVNIPCASVSNGAIVAAAGSLTVIATPAAGLLAVNTAFDAVLGVAVETDPQLRLRRDEELQLGGEGGVGSMEAALEEVAGVTSATVLENTTMTTDGNGLPPKSVMAVVEGGADSDVAAVVFTKGGGIETAGATTVNVPARNGQLVAVSFQRSTSTSIWVTVHIVKETDPSLPQYPIDGGAQIAAALVAFATGYGTGADVITSKLYSPIESVDGIKDVTAILIGTAPSPTTSTNIAIGPIEKAAFDVSRISIVYDS